jgi:mandelamide amidase
MDSPHAPLDALTTGDQNCFQTYIRQTDPGACAGIPGLSIPAGTAPGTTGFGGMPVGLELDGPAYSDTGLLQIGIAIERVLSGCR